MFRSSVFVPILTEGSISVLYFQKELKIATDAAKDAGSIIMPIFLDKLTSLSLLEKSVYHQVTSDNYSGSLCFIEDWFIDMFSREETLKKLSEEVETCIATSLYKKAFDLQ